MIYYDILLMVQRVPRKNTENRKGEKTMKTFRILYRTYDSDQTNFSDWEEVDRIKAESESAARAQFVDYYYAELHEFEEAVEEENKNKTDYCLYLNDDSDHIGSRKVGEYIAREAESEDKE